MSMLSGGGHDPPEHVQFKTMVLMLRRFVMEIAVDTLRLNSNIDTKKRQKGHVKGALIQESATDGACVALWLTVPQWTLRLALPPPGLTGAV